MKVQTIGKVQLTLGVIFLIATIVFGIMLFNDFLSMTSIGPKQITDSWTDVSDMLQSRSNQTNSTAMIVRTTMIGEVVSDLVIVGGELNIIKHIYIFGSAILAILSVILILQGLANMSRKQ